MVAITGAEWLAAVTAVTVGGLAFWGVVWQARKTRDQLHTGNGHTAGEGVSRIEVVVDRLTNTAERVEARQLRMETKLDKVEVRVDEQQDLVASAIGKVTDVDDKLDAHLTEVAPLAEWARGKIEGGTDV